MVRWGWKTMWIIHCFCESIHTHIHMHLQINKIISKMWSINEQCFSSLGFDRLHILFRWWFFFWGGEQGYTGETHWIVNCFCSHTQAHTYARPHTHTQTHEYAQTHAYAHTYTHTHKHMNMHTHTHTQTHKHAHHFHL